jgi:hypothetical protein
VGGVKDDGRGRLVDLAALDAHQPVLDVVDAAHTVGAAQVVQALDNFERADLPPSSW